MIIICKMCGVEVQTKLKTRLYCDGCRKVRDSKRKMADYEARREENLARKKIYYQKNRDKYRARASAYYYENREEILEYRRKLRKAMRT